LIPDAQVVLVGSQTERSITMTPAANQFGTATVTITVDDGNHAVTRSVVVTVTPVNDPPGVVSLDNATAEERLAGLAIGRLSAPDPDGDPLDFSVQDPRFEIVDGVLKLKDDQGFDLAAGGNVPVDITAADPGLEQSTTTLTLTIQANPFPWHNAALPNDVDRNDSIEALDVLIVINEINADRFNQDGILPFARPINDSRALFFDAAGPDGYVTPGDVLTIINWINAHLGLGVGEGVSADAPLVASPATWSEPTTAAEAEMFLSSVPSASVRSVASDEAALPSTAFGDLMPASAWARERMAGKAWHTARRHVSLHAEEQLDSKHPATPRAGCCLDSLDQSDIEAVLDDIVSDVARGWDESAFPIR
jgi:hypothetical protein